MKRRLFPSSKQWRRWALPSKLSFTASLASFIGLIIAIFSMLIQPKSSDDIDSKIKELDNIQVALTTLNSYVDRQQKILKNISTEKTTIEQEKNKLQKALEIDKDKLDALIEYQTTQERGNKWLEILISFLIGVLSSSVVTFFAIKYQQNKRFNSPIQQE